MDREEIKRRIAGFSTWHYQFELAGYITPGQRTHRHRLRRAHFFNPLVELCGGSLAGKRVLDLACNAGYWSLAAIEAGAEFVMGIDGRPMHIEQANFVFQVKEIERDRYRFAVGDVLEADLRQFGSFDVVLCLGLLYHVSKPMELMERMAEVNQDILLIDTNLSRAPGSYLEIKHERVDRERNALVRPLVMLPTKLCVIHMAQQLGYSVGVLRPTFRRFREVSDYRLGFRRAFLSAKHSDLSKLSAPMERVGTASQVLVEAPMWLMHKLLLRPFRRVVPWRSRAARKGRLPRVIVGPSAEELSKAAPEREDRR